MPRTSCQAPPKGIGPSHAFIGGSITSKWCAGASAINNMSFLHDAPLSPPLLVRPPSPRLMSTVAPADNGAPGCASAPSLEPDATSGVTQARARLLTIRGTADCKADTT